MILFAIDPEGYRVTFSGFSHGGQRVAVEMYERNEEGKSKVQYGVSSKKAAMESKRVIGWRKGGGEYSNKNVSVGMSSPRRGGDWKSGLTTLDIECNGVSFSSESGCERGTTYPRIDCRVGIPEPRALVG